MRRHQPPDRSFRIAKQRHRDRAFLRREQREQLPGRARRQLLEEPRALVGRHIVEQRRHVLLRHRLQQRVLLFDRQVFEGPGGVLSREDAKHDDLLVERQVGQRARQIARRPVSHQVAQPGEIAGADDGRQLVAGPRRLAHEAERGLAVGSFEFVVHMLEGGPHHIAVMHVRANGADHVEPERVNQIEIAGVERRRMRAELIGGGRAASDGG